MTKELILRGIPGSIFSDAWWLSTPHSPEPAPPPQKVEGIAPIPGPFWVVTAALAVLILIGDLLFWDAKGLGLSVPLFALAIFALATASVPLAQKRTPLALLIACLLPSVDYVQALSLAFALGGLVVAVIWARDPGHGLFQRALWLILRLPLWWGVLALAKLGISLPARLPAKSGLSATLRDWSLPLGGAFILLCLMTQANPLIESALTQLIKLPFDLERFIPRILFWTGIGLIVAPFLGPLPQVRAKIVRPETMLRPDGVWSVASVRNALITFNLMLAVQSLSDIGILWGAIGLPNGMTHAEYAHRGAYPLLATAMLAGGFSLIARPYLGQNRWTLRLQILWLAQNLFLCASALLRLWDYVDAFGLTYLRLHAAIWMALVAAGLGLVIWQNLKDRGNPWLMVRVTGLGLGTLYAACFVNFAAIIAGWNLTHHGLRDAGYLCELPGTAAAEVVEVRDYLVGGYSDGQCSSVDPYIPRGLRDWGFREWRVQRYLQSEHAKGPDLGQNPDR
jgi:hypothetical protein